MVKFALSAAYILIMPFLFAGTINRVKAFWGGRKGPPLLQPVFDIVRLLGKSEVRGESSSLVQAIGPGVGLAAALAAGLLAPLVGGRSPISFPGDFVLFAYLLGLSRLLAVLTALDAGSSFEGMGASREASFAAIAECGLLLSLGTLALISGKGSFSEIIAGARDGSPISLLTLALFALSFFVMILVEGSRVPVDDPNTHLELTMIHEVMVLDLSGPDLAFSQYSAWLKMAIFAGLASALVLPPIGSAPLSLLEASAASLALAVAVGLVESFVARARMSHVPQLVVLSVSVSVAALSAAAFFLAGGLK
jgi:formate hydrogenlyase subunit 4